MSASDDWLGTARALARSSAAGAPTTAPPGWEILEGRLPPVLDGDGSRALLSVVLAATSWLGASFRELVTGTAVDPLAVLMRLLAIGLTVRALILSAELARRLQIAARARRTRLVLSPLGLLFADGAREEAMERSAIISITLAGSWQTRRPGRRWADVLVVGSSRDALFLRIPPVFEHSPGVLSERLMRWLGPIAYDEQREFPAPSPLPSRVYEDAARGIVSPGSLAVPHGDGWIRRGPYASVLLALVLVEGLARVDSPLPSEVLGLALAAVALALVFPLGWWWKTRRELAIQRGIAFVLTPAELLLRARQGVLRTPWAQLQRVSIDERRAASVLDGVHLAKVLVLKRKDDAPIRYDEAYLGLPAEVAQALIDAYRTKALPRAPAGAPAGAPADVSAPDEAAQLDEAAPEGEREAPAEG